MGLLYVVEINGFSQSARTEEVLAGNVKDRFKAFSIKSIELKTTDGSIIAENASKLLKQVKENKPAALIIHAPRLCSHSKGDDTRTKDELEKAKLNDPLYLISQIDENFIQQKNKVEKEIKELTIKL